MQKGEPTKSEDCVGKLKYVKEIECWMKQADKKEFDKLWNETRDLEALLDDSFYTSGELAYIAKLKEKAFKYQKKMVKMYLKSDYIVEQTKRKIEKIQLKQKDCKDWIDSYSEVEALINRENYEI